MKRCKQKWLPNGFRVFVIMVTILLVSQSLMAQGSVSGLVKDKEGNPVPGATVAVKSKKLQTITDDAGKFTIAAANGDLILITSVGYDNYEIRVGKEPVVLIELT